MFWYLMIYHICNKTIYLPNFSLLKLPIAKFMKISSLKVFCFTYERFVQTLRRQFVGALPLSEQERHAQLLQQLREDKREAESIKERARRDQERVQVGNSLYSNLISFYTYHTSKKIGTSNYLTNFTA